MHILFKKITVLCSKVRIFVIFFALLNGGSALFGQLQPAAFDYSGVFQLHEQGLSGLGVKVASVCRSETYIKGQPQNDYLWNLDHNSFSGLKITTSDGLGGTSGHATSIGGILAGFEKGVFLPEIGDFDYKGAAFNAEINVFEFWRFISRYVTGEEDFDADILTMSVGSVFEDWWTRGIERLAANKGLVVVAGVGNGSKVFDPAYYPAAGGNVIGVGVIDPVINADGSESFDRFRIARPENSSSGPTWDGRNGVDIVAPGNCLVPDTNSSDGYTASGSWSSFATPVVAGTVALLAEKAKSDPELSLAVSPDGGNCVIKSVLLNSARKLPYWHKGYADKDDDHEYSLDFVQGAGRLDAAAALYQLTAGRYGEGIVPATGWDSDRISKNSKSLKYYKFSLDDPADKIISITLTWNRHFKDEFPFEPDDERNSDLRVELWAFDSSKPSKQHLLDYCDTKNDNIEHIYCPADPNYDSYEIVVTVNGGNKDSSDSERYALAWNVRPDVKDKTAWSDINGDGQFTAEDFAILVSRFGSSPDTEDGYVTGDINMDGVIDMKDLEEILKSRRKE